MNNSKKNKLVKDNFIEEYTKRYEKMTEEEKQVFIFGMAILTSVIIQKMRKWVIEERIKNIK